MILYVTGMHGSGTSLTSNYLHYCGVNMMGEYPMDHLGEHKIFRQLSHSILRDSNIHRYSPRFDSSKITSSKRTNNQMKSTVRNNLNFVNGNWGFKAPILSLCIWKWVPFLSKITNDKIIILHVVRHPFDVVESFKRRKSRKDNNYVRAGGNPERHIENIWYNYNKSVVDFQKNNNGYKVIRFGVDKLMKDPNLLMKEIGLEAQPINSIIKKGRFILSKERRIITDKSQKMFQFLLEHSNF